MSTVMSPAEVRALEEALDHEVPCAGSKLIRDEPQCIVPATWRLTLRHADDGSVCVSEFACYGHATTLRRMDLDDHRQGDVRCTRHHRLTCIWEARPL